MTEKFKITTRKTLERDAISQVLGIRELIKNRDVGDIVASPLPEYTRANDFDLKITIYCFPVKEPPFYKQGYVRPTINIPDITRSNITWSKIKKLAGGLKGYKWGRFRCTSNLDNGRQLAVYGGSEDIAEKKVDEILKVISAKEVTRSVTEEKKKGKRKDGKPMFKATTQVYPGYFTVISSKKVLDEFDREQLQGSQQIVNKLSGSFLRHKTEKIPLWVETEPSDAASMINEALKNRG